MTVSTAGRATVHATVHTCVRILRTRAHAERGRVRAGKSAFRRGSAKCSALSSAGTTPRAWKIALMGTSQLPTVRGTHHRPRDQTTATVRRPGAGVVLDRYVLERRLGAGAFGTVWAAHDQRLDREVAVKIVPRERIVGGRLEREARAAARLSHPSIVTLYEAAVDDDGAYLVSELVQGATLAQLLDAGRLSDHDIASIAISICDALIHAHGHGVVHRDVKPSNILVCERPTSIAYPAKLTDFGVARVIGGDSLTRTGDVIGTAAYMAPEQAEGREAHASADLYALAVVTYEALTGVNPVSTGTAAMRARRLGAHLPPLRRQRRDLPQVLGRAIDTALRPRPRERGQLEELREALVTALPELGGTAGIVETGWRPREHPPKRLDPGGRRHPGVGEDMADAFQAPADGLRTPADGVRTARHPWRARALAGVAASLATAWLSPRVLSPDPIAPAAAATLVGLLVVALPRLGWITALALMAIAATAQGHAGAAFVVVACALVPMLLLLRRGAAWPLSAAALALAQVGLAGAWPALAGQALSTAWRRAVVGLTGWIWVILASPIAGAGLYTGLPPGVQRSHLWAASLSTTFRAVLVPIVRSGALMGAPVWALAAAILPLIVGMRSLSVKFVLSVVWAAVTVSLVQVAIGLVDRGGAATEIRTAAAGAAVGVIVALGPSVLGSLRAALQPRGSEGELA